MVKIRLTRIGRKHLPKYRLVVIPHTRARDSRAIEYIGFYSPIDKEVKIDKERAEYWLSVGAQPSDTVRNLFIKEGILKAPKNKKIFSKKKGRKATERAEKEVEAQVAEAKN
ncbi:MAG: 30S ribosomal protein S16 [Candidatus Dojkabacteria bacterium]